MLEGLRHHADSTSSCVIDADSGGVKLQKEQSGSVSGLAALPFDDILAGLGQR